MSRDIASGRTLIATALLTQELLPLQLILRAAIAYCRDKTHAENNGCCPGNDKRKRSWRQGQRTGRARRVRHQQHGAHGCEVHRNDCKRTAYYGGDFLAKSA